MPNCADGFPLAECCVGACDLQRYVSLDELHDSYLETVRRYVAFSDDDLVQCRIIEAAARLAEGMVTAPLTSVLVESNVRSRYHFDLHK